MRGRVRKAFTLVEILIVVVILGILAAIVIPQFTSAGEEAQAGNVQTQLATIRNQIEMYRVRNNGEIPDLIDMSPDWGDPDGETNAERGLRGRDYLRTPPVNPRTGTSTVVAGVEGDELVEVTRGDDGWIFDADTGEIYANGFNEATGAWFAEDEEEEEL